MKKFFKLSKVKRLVILGSTLTAAILAIALGSTYYVSKKENVRKSIEYGGGAEYLVQVASTRDKPADIATDVAQSIYERINPLGVNGAEANAEVSGNDANIRVTYPGIKTTEEKDAVEELITSKPQLVLTDFYGNPLFNENGRFNSNLNGDPNGFKGNIESFYTYDKNKSLATKVPIDSNGAKASTRSDGSRAVEVTLQAGFETDWSNATKYISQLPEGKKEVLAWLDPQKLFFQLKSFYSQQSTNDWSTILKAINDPSIGMQALAFVLKDGKPTKTYYESIADAKNYLISVASVSQTLTGRKFEISGNFDSEQVNTLARRINYGVSDYKLIPKTATFVQAGYGMSAFNKAIIAGAVVFSLIAIVLMVNYGLLGALATISLALFVFLTLVMFTVMRGEYSPAAIAALIIGIGMAVDASIITFERLKSEVYAGASVKKAFAVSNKRSFSTIFDSNITTMIVAIVLFYFGTRSIIGLSVTLILSIIFTLVAMLIFTRITSSLLVRSGAFENKKWLVGLKPTFDPKVQASLHKFDYIKNAKWFALTSFGIAIAGIIVFGIFAGVHHSATNGLVLSQDFTGGTAITVSAKDQATNFTAKDIELINGVLNGPKYHLPSIDASKLSSSVVLKTTETPEFDSLKKALSDLSLSTSFDVNISLTTTDVAKQLVQDALIAVAISIAAIILYTLIRFKWTYSIAAIVALLHDAIIVVAVFAIARVEISPIFIAAILSVIGYSINDTIVTFDRIREKVAVHIGELDQARIKALANDAIAETLKRSLWTSLTTILAVIILMCFGNATKIEFNIAMLVGLVSGTYSSIFIATYLWTKLEVQRQKSIKVREKKGFWKVKGVEEQTITGINDFRS